MWLLLACKTPDDPDNKPVDDTADTAPAEQITEWIDGPPLLTARDHHVSFVNSTGGDFLYVMGGSDGRGALSGVERAPLDSDGAPGTFESVARMPEALLGMGLCGGDGAYAGAYAIAGGLDGTSNSTDTDYLIYVQDDGSLEFAIKQPMNNARYHLTLACVGDWLFAMGGLVQTVDGADVSQEISDVIERSSRDPDAPGGWEEIGALPEPRTHQAVAVLEDTIYLMGGGEGAAATATILRATVDADGGLSGWTEAGELPGDRATSSAFFRDGALYVIGGMETLTGREVDTVLRGEVQADGSIGAWTEQEALPQARAHSHQTPIFEDRIYSIGGSIEHMPQPEVYVGRFTAQ